MQKACMIVQKDVWTLTYTDHGDGSITVENFDKSDNDGYMFRESLGKLESIKELPETNRFADTATINGTEYFIRNKQNIYSYKQPL